MRPIEVPDEQIIEAGKQLIAAGRRVTGFGLRQITKSGETKRLKKVWDDYCQMQSPSTTKPLTDLPPEMIEIVDQVSRGLIDKIKKIAIELNDKAVKASETRVAVLVQDTNELRLQVEQELVDAFDSVNQLEKQLDDNDAEIKRLSNKLEEGNVLSQSQAVEIAQLRERLIAAEIHTKKEVEHSANILAKLTREKQALEAAKESQHKAFEILKDEFADKNAEIKQLKTNVLLVTEKNDDYLSELLLLKNTLAEQNVTLQHKMSEIAEMNVQLSVKIAESLQYDKQIVVLREQLAKTSGQLELAQAQNSALLCTLKHENTEDIQSESGFSNDE